MAKRVCVIDGCGRAHMARGWCNTHYERWRLNGDPLFVKQIRGDDEKRFWSHVDRRGDAECWPWTASLNGHGYGQISINGRPTAAYRWAYEHFVGPVPEGYEVDHVRGNGCVRKDCVNFLQHLEAVTHAENILRSDAPTAINARKTHCIRGHEFTEANTYRRPDGNRNCRACGRAKRRPRTSN